MVKGKFVIIRVFKFSIVVRVDLWKLIICFLFLVFIVLVRVVKLVLILFNKVFVFGWRLVGILVRILFFFKVMVRLVVCIFFLIVG